MSGKSKTENKATDKNLKKLEKLKQELAKLERTVANEGYQKSASSKVKEKHVERVSLRVIEN